MMLTGHMKLLLRQIKKSPCAQIGYGCMKCTIKQYQSPIYIGEQQRNLTHANPREILLHYFGRVKNEIHLNMIGIINILLPSCGRSLQNFREMLN